VQILPISKVKERLDELIDSASLSHEQVTITKNGSPVAVLIGADEWDALQETLFWLSQDGNREALETAREELAAGDGVTEAQIRTEFGVPKVFASPVANIGLR
jgi:antitoxin YefM